MRSYGQSVVFFEELLFLQYVPITPLAIGRYIFFEEVGSLSTAYLWCVWVSIKAEWWLGGWYKGHIRYRRYETHYVWRMISNNGWLHVDEIRLWWEGFDTIMVMVINNIINSLLMVASEIMIYNRNGNVLYNYQAHALQTYVTYYYNIFRESPSKLMT